MANNNENTSGRYIPRLTFENNYVPNSQINETHLLCKIRWGKYGKPWLHWCRNQPNKHAEVRFINNIFKAKNRSAYCNVTWYLSWSPCAGCAAAIVAFLEEHPRLKLTIYVARLYYPEEEVNREGLRLLRRNQVIIRVMDIADYNYCFKVFVTDQRENEDYWRWHFDPEVANNYTQLLRIFWENALAGGQIPGIGNHA